MRQKKCGIYKIVNNINGKIYVGSSRDIIKRWWDHRHYLITGTHNNKHLQHAVNLYGLDSFNIEVLEECSHDDLLSLEQNYIQKLNTTNRDVGYNIIEEVIDNRGLIEQNYKDFLVISPEGARFEINGLTKFCAKYNLEERNMHSVACGLSFSYKGWHCRRKDMNLDSWLKILKIQPTRNEKYLRWTLIFQDGKVIHIHSIHAFAKENGYNFSNLCAIARGKRKSHKDIISVIENKLNLKELTEKWV